MSSMYQASVPVFEKLLGALSNEIDKAAAFCTAKKIDPAALLGARLYPDMFTFTKQAQTSCDFAKNTVARLAGAEAPKMADTEASFDELKARIAKTLDYIKTFKAEQIDGSETRDITIPLGGNPTVFKGERYLLMFAMPNFYFHLTTAYAILRHNGVEIGKRDFLGGF